MRVLFDLQQAAAEVVWSDEVTRCQCPATQTRQPFVLRGAVSLHGKKNGWGPHTCCLESKARRRSCCEAIMSHLLQALGVAASLFSCCDGVVDKSKCTEVSGHHFDWLLRDRPAPPSATGATTACKAMGCNFKVFGRTSTTLPTLSQLSAGSKFCKDGSANRGACPWSVCRNPTMVEHRCSRGSLDIAVMQT